MELKKKLYMILPQIDPPETLSREYPFSDKSREPELYGFYKDIYQNIIQDPGLKDEKKNLEVINTIYKKSNYDFSS